MDPAQQQQSPPMLRLATHIPGLSATASPHSPSTTTPQTTASPVGQHPRASSPVHPPVSPITPPPCAALPLRAPSPLRNLSHAGQADVSAGSSPPPPPLPPPLDLSDNTDSIAVRAAISVLQIQRLRAEGDIHALVRAKADALDDPDAFARALVEGRVKVGGGNPDEDEDEDEGSPPEPAGSRPAYEAIPGPQNVVRCPPINWTKYAVMGKALDRLHADEVAQPHTGTPAVVRPGGSYELEPAGSGPDPAPEADDSSRQPYLGVAAPYSPFRDKIEKKAPRGGSRR